MPEVSTIPDLVERWRKTNKAFVRRDFEAMIRVIYDWSARVRSELSQGGGTPICESPTPRSDSRRHRSGVRAMAGGPEATQISPARADVRLTDDEMLGLLPTASGRRS